MKILYSTIGILLLSILITSCKKSDQDYTVIYQTEGENYSVSYATTDNNFFLVMNQSGKKQFSVKGYPGLMTQVSVTSKDSTKTVAGKILWRGEVLNIDVRKHIASAKAKIIE